MAKKPLVPTKPEKFGAYADAAMKRITGKKPHLGGIPAKPINQRKGAK